MSWEFKAGPSCLLLGQECRAESGVLMQRTSEAPAVWNLILANCIAPKYYPNHQFPQKWRGCWAILCASPVSTVTAWGSGSSVPGPLWSSFTPSEILVAGHSWTTAQRQFRHICRDGADIRRLPKIPVSYSFLSFCRASYQPLSKNITTWCHPLRAQAILP